MDLRHLLDSCELCPNRCRVDRSRGQLGRCRTGPDPVVSSASLHFGEEPVLVGRGGSGTIFLTGCNLSCQYCQNYEISQLDQGRRISVEELARLMLGLQGQGAENINLVSPTHQVPALFAALSLARARGLSIPLVYNCGGYENPQVLRELAGLVDIYMPDFKYGEDGPAEQYSGVAGYTRWCRAALLEMHRQVGDLEVDRRAVAVRGLLVRHLVLPHGLAASRAVVDFLADQVSTGTVLNIMDQYHPAYRAPGSPLLGRRVLRQEVAEVVDYARSRGLRRVLC